MCVIVRFSNYFFFTFFLSSTNAELKNYLNERRVHKTCMMLKPLTWPARLVLFIFHIEIFNILLGIIDMNFSIGSVDMNFFIGSVHSIYKAIAKKS